jgi:transcriptional regulator with XRE-family HTH domain
MLNKKPSRLRRMRTDRGWTLADVEARSGYSVTHLSAAERGNRNLGPRVVAALAKLYGVSENTIRNAV